MGTNISKISINYKNESKQIYNNKIYYLFSQ